MSRHSFSYVLIALLAVLAFTVTASSVYAQIPDSTSREGLIEEIKELAQQDAESGETQQSVTELDLLFGEEARVVGMRVREVLSIYKEAYAAAKPPEPWWAPFIRPNIGWVVAIILFVLLIFRGFLEQFSGAT